MSPDKGKYISGFGPIGQCNIAIVGIAPSYDEVRKGKPFTGPSGNLLREDLHEAGVNIDDCYLTNIFKFQLPNNEFKKYQEIGLSFENALQELQEEINTKKPNIIIGLGDPPLAVLAGKSGKNNGISIWRGSILNVLGRKALFTFHPAHELHGEAGDGVSSQYKPWQKFIRKFDIARACKESAYPDFRLPHRLIHIAKSSGDLFEFLERNKGKARCAVDIESIEHIPVCIGLSFNKYEALVIPLWNELQINSSNEESPKKSYQYTLHISSIPLGDITNIWKMLGKLFLDARKEFIGQNFKYDEEKLNRLGIYFHSLASDIMIKQKCLMPECPGSLAFMTSIHTMEPYYKYEGKQFDPKHDKIEDYFMYCGKDCCVTKEIDEELEKEQEKVEFARDHFTFRMQCHKAYLEMERIGLRIDENRREELIAKYTSWSKRLDDEFQQILGEHFHIEDKVSLKSHKQMGILFYQALNVPQRAGVGEEVLTALIANTLKDSRERDRHIIRLMNILLDHRRVEKTIDNYLSAAPDYDGRMKTSYFITGTETFRTSTQVVKSPVRDKQVGWSIQTVTKHGDVGEDLRSILVADKGFVFLNTDQAQAEPRVCSLLSDDEEMLEKLDKIDVHGWTAHHIFGGSIEDYDKRVIGYEKPERFVGKTARNAFNLGIGKHELMINVNTDAKKYKIDYNISEWKAGKIIDVLNRITPRIPEVYHEGIKECLSRNKRLYGTFGASRYFFAEWGRELWKEAWAFIPQQTVTDNTKRLLFKIQKDLRNLVYPVVESHDALTMLCPEKKVKEVIDQIKEWQKAPLDFSNCSLKRRELIIPWEFEVGVDYLDLKKYKE